MSPRGVTIPAVESDATRCPLWSGGFKLPTRFLTPYSFEAWIFEVPAVRAGRTVETRIEALFGRALRAICPAQPTQSDGLWRSPSPDY